MQARRSDEPFEHSHPSIHFKLNFSKMHKENKRNFQFDVEIFFSLPFFVRFLVRLWEVLRPGVCTKWWNASKNGPLIGSAKNFLIMYRFTFNLILSSQREEKTWKETSGWPGGELGGIGWKSMRLKAEFLERRSERRPISWCSSLRHRDGHPQGLEEEWSGNIIPSLYWALPACIRCWRVWS